MSIERENGFEIEGDEKKTGKNLKSSSSFSFRFFFFFLQIINKYAHTSNQTLK